MITIATRHDGLTVATNDLGEIVMIDAPDEVEPYAEFVRVASGRVLLLGLGLGIMASMLLEKPDVRQVVAVEIEPDLCRYVAEKIDDPRLTIINANCWEVSMPGVAFDYGYYSIWHLRDLSTWHEKEGLKSLYASRVSVQYVDWEDVLDEWMRFDRMARNVHV